MPALREVQPQHGGLAAAAERLAAAPNCRRFLETWQSWRSGSAVPVRAEARPESLGRLLGAVSVLEVVAPDRIVIRLVASDIENFAGRTRKGENFVKLVRPDEQALRIERHQNVVNTPCGGCGRVLLTVGTQVVASVHGLMLPVAAEAGAAASFVYVATDIQGEKDWDVIPPGTAGVARDFHYIDIGAGLPAATQAA